MRWKICQTLDLWALYLRKQSRGEFLWKPPCFTLSAFEVVYPTFHTSHRIGKVLKKYLFSAKIIEEAEHFILSRHFYTLAAIIAFRVPDPPSLNLSLHISGWIRSFWASFDILLKTMFFFNKKSYGKGVDPPPLWKIP